jgi:3-oxoacyl-[acyl-carrier protein] reductase
MNRIVVFGESDIGIGISKIYPTTTIIPKDKCDIRDASAIRLILSEHQPEIVVNCAGISNVQPIHNSDIAKWQEELDVNLLGSYLLARESVSYDKNIIMIFLASVAGMYGKPNHSGYCASKSAVISLTQSLAMEGYKALSISPGRVDTKMREKDFPGEDKRTRLSTLEVAEIVKNCIEGKYAPGDNIVIRKRGFRKLHRIDSGQPWREYLNVRPV